MFRVFCDGFRTKFIFLFLLLRMYVHFISVTMKNFNFWSLNLIDSFNKWLYVLNVCNIRLSFRHAFTLIPGFPLTFCCKSKHTWFRCVIISLCRLLVQSVLSIYLLFLIISLSSRKFAMQVINNLWQFLITDCRSIVTCNLLFYECNQVDNSVFSLTWTCFILQGHRDIATSIS